MSFDSTDSVPNAPIAYSLQPIALRHLTAQTQCLMHPFFPIALSIKFKFAFQASVRPE